MTDYVTRTDRQRRFVGRTYNGPMAVRKTKEKPKQERKDV